MTYSKKRFFSSAVVALLVVALILYFVASSTIVMGNLSVLGIGGVFVSADQLNGDNVVAYPVKGDIQGYDAITDTPACEERPMLAFGLDTGEVQGLTIYKDVKIPFFEEQWMSVQIDEPNGALNGEEITFYVTQLAIDRWEVTNVEITEGGNPGRGSNYTPVGSRTRSTDIWGPNSGEFLLISDPKEATGDPPTGQFDNDVTGIKAWTHAITGQNAEFIADVNDPSALIDLQISYVNTSDLRNRYEAEGIQPETRNPATYNRTEYFDCLPGS